MQPCFRSRSKSQGSSAQPRVPRLAKPPAIGLFQGTVSFDDPNFHRRELTLLASRNARPGNFREIIALIEAGRIDTTPWISQRFGLAETPRRFPEIAANPDIIKTIIAVDV